MNPPISTLLQATRIWQDDETKKEHFAAFCVRWADVERIEEDVDAGLSNWEYKEAITYLIVNGIGCHIIGKHTEWIAKWVAYTNSAQAMLLSPN